MALRRLLVTTGAAVLAVACGGMSSSNGPTKSGAEAGVGEDASRHDAGSDANATTEASCSAVGRDYDAIANTTAYRTCAAATDCAIVSSDVCFDTSTLSVNAAGVAASQSLRKQWHDLHDCGVGDCGSGGGPSLTPSCSAGSCVALLADGGVYTP
jgi:hypothetical protein